MTPMQQMFLGLGAVSTKTYVNDVFSTWLYEGSNSNTWYQNGILSTDADGNSQNRMLWIKNRGTTDGYYIWDSTRGDWSGGYPYLMSNNNNIETINSSYFGGSGFQSNGFQAGYASGPTAGSGNSFASWMFKTAPGFFDIQTYTGNGSNRTISHNLGSIPGCIMIKCRSDSADWMVYHKDLADINSFLRLNTTAATNSNTTTWNGTLPTATEFSLGTYSDLNANGETYVAYIFAGGESTASEAVSVDFDGATDGDALTVADFPNFLTDNFTVECWIYPHTVSGGIDTIMDNYQNSSAAGAWWALHQNDDGFYWGKNGGNPIATSGNLEANQWYHVAMVRNGTDNAMYLNGKKIAGFTETAFNYSDGGGETRTLSIARQHNPGSGRQFDGLISNVRIVKGTAVYTGTFRPSTAPLTNITNTQLLCCQSSTVTTATVTPGTITAISTPTSDTSSPFDDPDGFKFGPGENENTIKTGKYVGNGLSAGPEVYVGFEPQWLLIKHTGGNHWELYDSMRGIITDGPEAYLEPDDAAAEYNAAGYFSNTATGFVLDTNSAHINGNNETYIYIAIRRPDGYVGKPADAGTDAFAMDTGNSSETIPVFNSTFPVDFGFMRIFAGSQEWYTSARLISGNRVFTDGSNAEASLDGMKFDSNIGWASKGSTYSWGTSYQSWMWKRGAGFDVVTYTGNGVARQLPHSLNNTPEMIWVKNRTQFAPWMVYHKGLDGGTNPEQYFIELQQDSPEEDNANMWNDTAPTSKIFTLGTHGYVNEAPGGTGDKFIAMLFSSVTGISKVGSYTGNGSATERTITLGFQPRFVIVKNATEDGHDWQVLDTERGWASGVDNRLFLNTNAAQVNSQDIGQPAATGFTLTTTNTSWNNDTDTFIYYAHA